MHRAVVLNYDSMVVDGGAEEILPSDQRSPDAILLERERQSYLHDASTALPERLRHVVEGYFFQERPMKELADELGVTESRVSQMRAEALMLLKDGMNSQLEPEVEIVDTSAQRSALLVVSRPTSTPLNRTRTLSLALPATLLVAVAALVSLKPITLPLRTKFATTPPPKSARKPSLPFKRRYYLA